MLNLRANNSAFYITSHGRRVHAVGFVDDTEHYGKSINDLLKIIEELGLGNIATRIGFAWAKFTAYASDWDEDDNNINASVLPNLIKVVGWDIWERGCIHATVPRAYADTIETLLGKL